jgi:ankyrin repeat protein
VSDKSPTLDRIKAGRTDLVFDYISEGHAPASVAGGMSLIKWCAHYGDVSAIKFLLASGEQLASLGENLGLDGAVFHGHMQLSEYLIEAGADVNHADGETHETPLHAALCKTEGKFEAIIKLLLANGADPNRATKPGIATEMFMRDIRTRAETPLHRAAAFGSESAIQTLIDAGARKDAKDMNGDSPLTWASWHLRPRPILRLLAYDSFRVDHV